jgi:hypothetical protein
VVPKRRFELSRDKAIGVWRKLPDEWLYNLYLSPDIFRMIRSRRMR